MSKISPDGFVKTDIFKDFSIFNFNNIYIGEYAAKINKGSNNLIIGANAGKIGIGLNNSIFIGPNAGSEFLDRNKVITIGDIQVTANKIDAESINIGYNIRNNSNGIVITNDKQHPQLFLNESSLDIGIYNQGICETSIGNYNSNINSYINIGYSNISTVNNSIVIGNSITNNKFSLNIDDVLCVDDKGIYIGCGIYKNVPIILGSSSLNTFMTSNNLDMGNNFITSVFKIKNDNNISISFITDTNENIIYNLPLAPKYEHSFLSVDINGNLEWIDLSKAKITDINSTAHIICNNLESLNLNGDGSLLTNINISNNTTDNLREGIHNLYLNIDLITKIFYSYIQTLTTDDIQNGNRNNYFHNYSNNFYSNLNLLTTDDIGGNRFYSLNDYYSNTSNYLFNLHTDIIKEGTSNFYYNPSNLTTNFIKEGISNLYFNGNLNINNTDIIKEGQSNLYYHQLVIVDNNLSNTTTDFLKQGLSNLYATDNNLYEYVKSNLPTTDYIIQGTSNDYFCNISNQNKYSLITDNIREGSNFYYKSSNQITGIISFNTNTDFYKEGTSNLYFYEKRAVDDYLKVITSNVTTDNFSNGINKKFITNNFYNNNLQINGFLKANNINDLDKENLRLNLEPKIGPLTEVYQVYDFERLSVIGRLSNIEIGYTVDNNNDIKVPFIVIDNKVGINNSNPRYQLDVNGIINCSNLLIDNQYYYCNIVTITSNQILERVYSNTSYISSNNSNQLFNRFAFATGSADFTNYYTNDILSNIFITSNVLSNTSNRLVNQINDISRLSNIFITSNVLSNTSNQLFNKIIYSGANIFTNENIFNSNIFLYGNIQNDDNYILRNKKINGVTPFIWYKFDGSLTWLIDSINGSSLTVSSDSTVVYDSTNYVFGSGSALFNNPMGNNTLTKNDGVDIINTVNNFGGITFTFWIYGYYFNVGVNYLRIYMDGSGGYYELIISGVNNFFTIKINNFTIATNLSVGSLNTWNFFSMIIQKDGIWKIYVNGVNVRTVGTSIIFTTEQVFYTTNTMIIGHAYMNIDDFKIFRGILTDAQIKDLYNNVDISIPKYNISSDIFVTSNVLFDKLNKTWVVNDTSNIYNNNSSNVGIGISTPTYKLHVVGNVGVSGSVSQGFSDIRLKNKIGSIKNPFLIINNLESFYYTPNDLAKSFGFIDNNRTIGLNALEVQKYIPEAVSIAPFDMDENKQSKSGENYLTISYEKLIPVLLEGLKELKKEVEELKMK